MTVTLVTGAIGAIGRHVVRQLTHQGCEVVGIGHGARPQSLPLAAWINGEINSDNLGVLMASRDRPAAVIHLAGGSTVGPSLTAPAEDFFRTAAATVRLLEWVRQTAPEAAVVLASSAAVYGDAQSVPILEDAALRPLSPYGTHKAMMEMVGASWGGNFGIKVASVRLFSVYGPGLEKQLIWEICNQLAQGRTKFVLGGTGAETRDWVHIKDAARILIAAISRATPLAPSFNGCTGVAVSVADAVHALGSGWGREIDISFNGLRRIGDPEHLVGDPRRAAAAGLATKIAPIDGLRQFGADFRATH
ncbi:MAG TPA: SDR family oxidoreductase [Rhizomicrobium sp.]|jgi:UDP-glucose 4-epimerase|nr:SDR family oxidoreductase [Rhizomicrobium sp.]